MKIALVQLSDIHLTENPAVNPVLKRGDAVAQAVTSVCHGISHGVLVVSGDTAYSGKEAEYRHGRVLIEGIRAKLASFFTSTPVRVLTTAGNHDCDFKLGTSVRDIVIGSLKPERIDDAVIKQCVGVQEQYRSFAAGFEPSPVPFVVPAVDCIYRQSVVNFGKKKRSFFTC